jgi:excinuclease ABC subunit C
MELLAAALSTRADARVDIHAPKRGERRQILDYALRNAREALGRRLAETASQEKLLTALAQAIALPRVPRRVEVYDNSHIMGASAVGAMIVAGAGGFMKQHYRTFNMRSEELKPGDDYGMMREMLRRRFARLAKEAPREPSPVQGEGASRSEAGEGSPRSSETEALGKGSAWVGDSPPPATSGNHPSGPGPRAGSLPEREGVDEAFPAWPDLVLIDGGKGQMEAARAAMEEVGVADVPVVGIAKGRDRDAGRETFFAPGRPPFKLPPRDPALYFIQRLRDEAHRFAIGAHRAKRKRELKQSPLDEISGIGPTRKRALLHHFGTVKAIGRASLDDLAKAPGVNAATAKAVYDHFHDGG